MIAGAGGCLARIRKELEACQKGASESGVTAIAHPSSSDPYQFLGTILGPEGTPYHEGLFELLIEIPQNYPFEPPKIQFITKIWHPNISSQTGAICLDILKDNWSPALTIKTALLSIQALLSAAEPDDPQDAQVAQMYLEDLNSFNQTAKFWTETYARAKKDTPDGDTIQRFVDMGFEKDAATKVLLKHQGDEQSALEELLQSLA